MISFQIDGQPLSIIKGTNIQIELNNNSFNTERVEGDIVFTFDVPAKPNDIVFQHARFVYVQRLKKYQCTILVANIQIASGDLYIQKATKQSYSCGLVLNPLPKDFSEKKIAENDYGAPVVISSNIAEHRQKWKAFLKASLDENSVYKFPLFVNTAFYGSSNEDYGWYLLPTDNVTGDNPSGYQASLATNDSVGLDKHYINRLLIDSSGNPIEVFSNSNRGCRLFNNSAVSNPNSFTFAPAIRLSWILEKIVNYAGYRICGNFNQHKDIQRIFSQSLRAMDGLPSQYDDIEVGATASISPAVNYYSEKEEDFTLLFSTIDGTQAYEFFTPTAGNYQFSVTINTYLPANFLKEGALTNGQGEDFKEAIIFMLGESFIQFPPHLNTILSNDWNQKIGRLENGQWSPYPWYSKVYTLEQLQSEIGYVGAGFYTFHFNFTQYLSANRHYSFFFEKMTGKTIDYLLVRTLENYHSIPITQEIDTFYKVYNSFANKLKFEQHVPNLTNGEFITNICNTFGLAMFIESTSGQMEFSFFKDILDSVNTLDLTSYVLSDKYSIEKYEPKTYLFKTKSLHSEEIDENKLLPPVRTHAHLPDAVNHFGKICFVENENQYRIAEKIGDAIENWIFVWNPYSGNNQVLEIGEGQQEEITLSFATPNMKITDEQIAYKNFIMQIESEGCSPIFNTGNNTFEMILVNYHGREELRISQNSRVYYESVSPVNIGKNGEEKEGLNLSINGKNSLEQFVTPWLQFLSSHEKVYHRFIFTLPVFLEVIKLLKPQNTTPDKQTRWVLVNNTRLIPIKMVFQFTEGSRSILADIEFAKEVVGV